jgi:hypothetical protein
MKKVISESVIDLVSVRDYCPTDNEIKQFYSMGVNGLYSCWGELDVDPDQVIANIKKFVFDSIINALNKFSQSIPDKLNDQNNTERTHEISQHH